MGSAPDAYAQLKEQLKSGNAEVFFPGDGEKYEQSIKRWSEHCEKRAVCYVPSTTSVPRPVLPPLTCPQC
jgi:hypothetical protein